MVAKSSLISAIAAALLSSLAVISAVGPATPTVSLWNADNLHA
jgi:hypothetical protein